MSKTADLVLGIVFVTVIPAVGSFYIGRLSSKMSYSSGRYDAYKEQGEKLKIIVDELKNKFPTNETKNEAT